MARSSPSNEPDLREYLLAEAVEFRRLMVETLIENPQGAQVGWTETSKAVDRLSSGAEHPIDPAGSLLRGD